MSYRIVDHPLLGQTRLALTFHSKVTGTTYLHNDGQFYPARFLAPDMPLHCPKIVSRREANMYMFQASRA